MELEIAGLAEVAGILGVAKRTALRYTSRSDFPEPVARLAATPVWRRQDIEEWCETTLPLAHDPRTSRDERGR